MRTLTLLLVSAVAVVHAQPAPADIEACLDRVEPYVPGAPSPPDSAFTLALRGPGGALLYIGAEHSTDPAHPQITRIEAAYRAFAPSVVYYEGPERPFEPTAEATVRAFGESGLVRWLAARDGVSVARLEPDDPRAEFAAVAERVGPERAALFFVLREASRLRDRQGLAGPDLDAAVAALLTRAAPLGLPIASLEALSAAYAREFSSPSDWRQAPAAWFDPGAADAATGGVFMAVANRASSGARDRHMARVLAEAVRRGERVFAVVGRNHVPMQAPALRCALR